MRLILGPPGSGKTTSCLDKLREALRVKRDNCRLIVPTATMGEHLRNELAREGFVFKPALVSTFTKFVEPSASPLRVWAQAQSRLSWLRCSHGRL